MAISLWDRVPDLRGEDDVADLLRECERDGRCRDRELFDRVEVFSISFGVRHCFSGTVPSESSGGCYVAMDGNAVVAKWTHCDN